MISIPSIGGAEKGIEVPRIVGKNVEEKLVEHGRVACFEYPSPSTKKEGRKESRRAIFGSRVSTAKNLTAKRSS